MSHLMYLASDCPLEEVENAHYQTKLLSVNEAEAAGIGWTASAVTSLTQSFGRRKTRLRNGRGKKTAGTDLTMIIRY